MPPSLVSSAPPPILHSLNPHSSHLRPPVHQNWPLEVLDLDPLHDLPVQGVLEGPRHPHAVVDVLPALMVVDAVEPQHRLVLVTSFPVVEVLSSSGVAIPARLALVSGSILPTLPIFPLYFDEM